MIKLKTSQSSLVLSTLINKNILKHPVYKQRDGIVINKSDLDETLKVFKELQLRAVYMDI
jgi:Ni2+-binding GTPase involved in maturation of urease and hydrogenase